MRQTVQIANRKIGKGEPVFLVVEAGTTCNGDVATALKMADAAKESGADAIKFMIIGPEEIMSDTTVVYEYDTASGHKAVNMFEMFKELVFTTDEWRTIKNHCDTLGIIFYATVDYVAGVDIAVELGAPALKISSWDVTNYPLIDKMAATKLPIQVDLGPATRTEISELLDRLENGGCTEVLLEHCTHAKQYDQYNLLSIPYLEKTFGVPAGYSGDSRDPTTDIAAVALGAKLIEKRLTLNHKGEGHHDSKALEPNELKEYFAQIRLVESTLGVFDVVPSTTDFEMRSPYFVSVVAAVDIPEGVTISPHMLTCKRPGTGLHPKFLEVLIGKRAVRSLKKNQLLTSEDVGLC